MVFLIEEVFGNGRAETAVPAGDEDDHGVAKIS